MLLGEIAALANAVIWASLSVVLGGLAGRLSATRVNAVQLSFAAVFYLLLVPFFGGARLFAGLTAPHFLALLGTAILTMGVGDSLYFTSIQRLGASRASPISVSTFPLITLVLGALLLGERLTWSILGGAILIIAGIVLLVSQSAKPEQKAATADKPPKAPIGDVDAATNLEPVAAAGPVASLTPPIPESPSMLPGVLLVLGAAVCWSAATLGLRVAAAGIPAVGVTAIRVPTAAIFLLAVLRGRGRLTIDRIRGRDWLVLLCAGIVGTGLGSLTYIMAIQGTGAGLTALLTSTSPLWVLPLAAIFLHERLTPRVVLGAGLAIGGIWLVLI
jgi:drug/metabolite transporter (DMT)-like permease